MDQDPVAEAMRAVLAAQRTGGARDVARAAQHAQDVLDAVKADALGRMVETREFELDGASTARVWAANELRLSGKALKSAMRVGDTMRQLPAVGESARAGRIRAEHVVVLGYGLRHLGADVMERAQRWLLDVAESNDPGQLFGVVKELREALYPDELDEAWIKGMDKQDIQVQAVPDGWHVTGFLNIATGAKFQRVLDALAAPRDADDQRSGSERRVQALDDLSEKVLASGLPSDGGVRPHLSVIVDVDTHADALGADLPDGVARTGRPARLAGFGSVGPRLLSYLTCVSDVTPVVSRGRAEVLDVGRTQRLATLKQRRAILARQGGVCAAPGCTHTHLEIHHVTPWSQGGRTDLDDMIGLCVRCHHLLHRGLLTLRGDAVTGFRFTDSDNRQLLAAYRQRAAARREDHRIRHYAVQLHHKRRPGVLSRT